MITKIIAHNFQSHKHTEVNLKEGFTVVIGDSDQGKTSLIKRALLWVMFNEPNGNSFVRYKDNGKILANGEREREPLCYVTIEFDNGVVVTRKREKNKNIYEWVDENGIQDSMENFKNEVPVAVISALGVDKLYIDDDLKLNTNIIGSRDAGLLDKTGSVKAKIIGSFVGTNEIDIATRSAVNVIKKNTSEKEFLIKERDKVVQKIEDFGEVKEYEEIILSVQEKEIPRTEKMNEFVNIHNIHSKIVKNEQEIKDKTEIINNLSEAVKKKEANINNVSVLFENATEKYRRYSEINKFTDLIAKQTIVINNAEKVISVEKEILQKEENINNINGSFEVAKEKVDLFKKIDSVVKNISKEEEVIKNCTNVIKNEENILNIEKSLKDINDKKEILQEKFVNYNNFETIYRKMVSEYKAIKQIDENIVKLEDNIKKMSEEYSIFMEQFETCPFCNQIISKEHIAEMIENV